MVCGIRNIHTATKDCHSGAVCLECGSSRNTVDALCHTADDKRARRGKLIRHFIRLFHSVCTHTARSHDPHAKIAVEIGQVTAIVQKHWRLLNLAQGARIGILVVTKDADALSLALVEDLGGALQTLITERTLSSLGQARNLLKLDLLGAKDIKRRIVKGDQPTKCRRTCAKRFG